MTKRKSLGQVAYEAHQKQGKRHIFLRASWDELRCDACQAAYSAIAAAVAREVKRREKEGSTK